MNVIGNCEECQRLASEYEGATIQWFRVQGQLRVAEFSRDEEASSRIVAELSQISARRQALRQTAEQHNIDVHPRVVAAT